MEQRALGEEVRQRLAALMYDDHERMCARCSHAVYDPEETLCQACQDEEEEEDSNDDETHEENA